MPLAEMVTLGQYVPGTSFLHRMDPRVKSLLAVFFLTVLFFINKISGYIFFLFFLFLLVELCGISLKYLFKGLRPILILILFTLVAQGLFSGEGRILFSWGIITVSDVGLWKAIFMSMRLAMLVFVTTLLTLVTSPIDLTDGMDRMLSFLTHLRIPIHEVSMMMTIALRFIPTLLDETDKIIKAQISRGAPLDRGNIFKRLRALISVFIPLFVSAFRRADELAMAMESRCYRGGKGRTRMKEMRVSPLDLWGSLVAILAGFLSILLNFLPYWFL
ncbi:MAG: energy-coupling factor transporter transmembrane protein EcfT [Caldiserica bacterium]|nr:energy-coupling factor transporter transmembrane protein EcfT [Caldisericota bacterium]MDH7563153.1 energy-coupling factor transporter transmembrane component T [Caldisericota bacterium]